jgi:acyl dehydratase
VTGLPEVAVGDEVPGRTVTVTRADLVRYAGASGDLNPIHWNDRTALAVGLPGVIAHGMFTMALAAQFVADWAGGASAVRSFSTRFTRPVVVPDDDEGAAIALGATVKAVEDDGSVTLAVTATGPDGKGVLGKAIARCAPRS